MYLYRSCLRSRERSPLYLLKCHELLSVGPRTGAVRGSHRDQGLASNMKRRTNQQQLEIAGVICLVETILKQLRVREKATQNVKWQPSGKSAAISSMYWFRPSPFDD